MYVLSYTYVNDPVEHKITFQTFDELIDKVKQLLRGDKKIASIRVSAKYN
jgi:hypothetical protein